MRTKFLWAAVAVTFSVALVFPMAVGVAPERGSINVARKFFPSAASVFVATGRNYPDALVGAAVGGAHGYPVILANTPAQARQVSAVGKQIGARSVRVIGGTSVVSAATYNALTGFSAKSRFGGKDRFDTADRLNRGLGVSSGNHAWVASGYNFPDALVAAGYAGRDRVPLVISKRACMPDNQYSYLTSRTSPKITGVRLAGGSSVLSFGTRNAFRVCR